MSAIEKRDGPSLPHSLAPSLPHSLACYAMVHHTSSHATGQTHACSQQYGPEGTHVQLRQRPAMTLAAIGDAERSVFGASSSPPSTILRLHPLSAVPVAPLRCRSPGFRSKQSDALRICRWTSYEQTRTLLWCAQPSYLRLAPNEPFEKTNYFTFKNLTAF